MPSNELLEYTFHGREERNLEYKPSLSWNDKSTKAKIAKAAMAMANILDGGVIVLGVEEDNGTFDPIGMGLSDASTFKPHDVMDHVNSFADPFVDLTVTSVTTDDGRTFVVIQVREFAEIPVVCKKNGPENLQKGAIYTRSARKIETATVSSQSEMREILDRATTKGMQKRLRMLHEIGIRIGYEETNDLGRQLFEDQLGDL